MDMYMHDLGSQFVVVNYPNALKYMVVNRRNVSCTWCMVGRRSVALEISTITHVTYVTGQ